jgi:hypothetical protein
MEHSTSGLSNPLKFAFMAVVGCAVGHSLMAPLGLFEVSAKIGAFFTEITGNALNLASAFGIEATKTAASVAEPIAHSFATPFCHFHGAELVCH